jgi:protein SCO1/2
VLTDETGAPVALRDLLTIPTLIAPVYFSCPTDCNILLGTLSQILPQVGLSPGREYQVLAVSFDERDTPALAAQKQREFLTAMQAPFPPAGWRFLSADLPTIRRLMDGLGFGFVREGATFRHPVVTIAVSPQGRITRYLYGSRPLPFDIALAATEAAGDKVGFSVKRAVAMCYSYDPASRRYVFDLMRVAGFSVLFAIGLFALFLAFGGKKKPRS